MESTHLPDDGRLQAFLDDELSADERHAMEAHVAACEPCARALEELRLAASAVHDLVERQTPDEARHSVAPHPAFLRRSRTPAARSLARAAGIALLLAGSAAVLEATTGWIGAAVRAVRSNSEVPVAPTLEVPAAAGDALFTVAPRGGTLEVRLAELDAGTVVVVREGDTVVGEIRVGEGSADVAYSAGPGSGTVTAPGVSEIEVVLPSILRSGRVVVNGATAIVKAPERLFSVRQAEGIVGGFRFSVED
ncbi:MAG TPA: zf-HC2 domain-containing protein [Longimicrobiales bacterium]|nr:zf-HC2 domain-containing protein [Longimicrobiales bacterium]